MPSLLEYFSYLFHYSTLLAGPVCTFREFNDFIDGSDVRPKVMYHARVKSANGCYSSIDDKDLSMGKYITGGKSGLSQIMAPNLTA